MRKLENTHLDEIGKVLVRIGATPNTDIEKAISNPDLFDAIKHRIAMTAERPVVRRSRVLVPGLASFASVALVAVIGLAFFRSGTDLPSRSAVPPPTIPEKTSASIKKHSEPDGTGQLPLPRDQVVPIDSAPIKVERVSHRAQTVRVPRVKQPAPEQVRFVDDFYAVSYAGDPHETERGGRIVRVDIPRSTLFAMGFNVPLENDSATVKADLLVGSDGVTRAIRVVE